MNSFWYSLNPRFPCCKTKEKLVLFCSKTTGNMEENYSPLLHDVIVFSFVPADMKLRIRLTQQPTADSSPIAWLYDVKLCV